MDNTKETTLINNKIDSIEVSRNAKGDCAWKIKLYYNNEEKKDSEIISKIEQINSNLKSKFGK